MLHMLRHRSGPREPLALFAALVPLSGRCRVGPTLDGMGRSVVARLHNPGNHECACLPSCLCQRKKIGYAVRWYTPGRFHKMRNPFGFVDAGEPDGQA